MTTSLPRRPRRLRVLAVAALVAGLTLSACSAHPGQAAVVSYTDLDGGSHELTISEAQLDQVAAELKGSGGSRVDYLESLANLPALDEVARAAQVQIPQDQVRAAAQEIAPGADLSRSSLDVVRAMLLQEALQAVLQTDPQAVAVAEDMRESLKVTTSPRYRGVAPWALASSETSVPLG